jgi:2,4-dienoyl-CoA reductase-like NADH-dependent reductase (Old Yellow Enzyme family)
MIFEPFEINGVEFKNRLIRSSIGGRTAYYDGTVNNAWKNFEHRFAKTGVGGIVSATLNVDDRRWSPLEYPQISNDKFVSPLAEGIRAVHSEGCRYIIQIGDGGYQVQTSLFSQEADQKSASSGFDLLYGYRNVRSALTIEEIEHLVEQFGQAARRTRDAGADGVEVTLSKGYMIHQFLNPAINARTDRYGGTFENRFQLVREIMTAVRSQVGADYVVGVRISARDANAIPLNVRLPIRFPLREFFRGNGLEEYLTYATWLKDLGVDYLHVSNGFGFVNPLENPGGFPVDEVRMFFNSNRHLSAKANVRAAILNLIPRPILKSVFGAGWTYREGNNLEDARAFKLRTGLPVIANGGFQHRSAVEGALSSGSCDFVSMARALLANPDLPKLFEDGVEGPERPCTYCNRCAVRTTMFPLGCYEPARFASTAEMEAQILEWSGQPNAPAVEETSSSA